MNVPVGIDGVWQSLSGVGAVVRWLKLRLALFLLHCERWALSDQLPWPVGRERWAQYHRVRQTAGRHAMRRLGHGLQYTVYDAGSRVYKRPATRAEMR